MHGAAVETKARREARRLPIAPIQRAIDLGTSPARTPVQRYQPKRGADRRAIHPSPERANSALPRSGDPMQEGREERFPAVQASRLGFSWLHSPTYRNSRWTPARRKAKWKADNTAASRNTSRNFLWLIYHASRPAGALQSVSSLCILYRYRTVIIRHLSIRIESAVHTVRPCIPSAKSPVRGVESPETQTHGWSRHAVRFRP